MVFALVKNQLMHKILAGVEKIVMEWILSCCFHLQKEVVVEEEADSSVFPDIPPVRKNMADNDNR